MITDAQLRKIFACFNGLGIKDYDKQKQIIKRYIKIQHYTDIESTKELSVPWAIGLIDMLDKSTAKQLLTKYGEIST